MPDIYSRALICHLALRVLFNTYAESKIEVKEIRELGLKRVWLKKDVETN
jgi:hypothetical protein